MFGHDHGSPEDQSYIGRLFVSVSYPFSYGFLPFANAVGLTSILHRGQHSSHWFIRNKNYTGDTNDAETLTRQGIGGGTCSHDESRDLTQRRRPQTRRRVNRCYLFTGFHASVQFLRASRCDRSMRLRRCRRVYLRSHTSTTVSSSSSSSCLSLCPNNVDTVTRGHSLCPPRLMPDSHRPTRRGKTVASRRAVWGVRLPFSSPSNSSPSVFLSVIFSAPV